MFSEKDLAQIRKKGISSDQVEKQLSYFIHGIPPLNIDRPATAGDGIIQLEQATATALAENFDRVRPDLHVTKFVPASGAATRMFKDLFSWREALAEGTGVGELMNREEAAALFFGRLKDFAFWEDLSLAMFREDLDAEHLLADRNVLPLLDFILFDYGLDYAALPKGLLAFHRYGDHSRTPFEEHLVEAVRYAAGRNGTANVHFTVSPDHLEKFRALSGKVAGKYARDPGTELQVDFSLQKPSTDTIAVDMENRPFRDLDGSLLFRPGGHGALIENLNDLASDMVFVKNIDNVVPDHLKEDTIMYKKALGGMLADIQEKVHQWADLLDRADSGKGEALPGEAGHGKAGTGPGSEVAFGQGNYQEAVDFCCRDLNMDPAVFPAGFAEGIPVLRKMLNRPIRVCGMVRNLGEPGGGPFWVKDPHTGEKSLQIVESSQVNMEDPAQAEAFNRSTHFNPVDLVCATRNHRGELFDLRLFVDPATGFISEKSKDGRRLKALELPGLWNGAMANWITLFVEVPLSTFNPVKVVNDLLREEHQQPGSDG